jgi:hypothetical protein
MARSKRKVQPRPPAVTRRGFLGTILAVGAAVVVDKDRPDPKPKQKVRWIGHW